MDRNFIWQTQQQLHELNDIDMNIETLILKEEHNSKEATMCAELDDWERCSIGTCIYTLSNEFGIVTQTEEDQPTVIASPCLTRTLSCALTSNRSVTISGMSACCSRASFFQGTPVSGGYHGGTIRWIFVTTRPIFIRRCNGGLGASNCQS